MFFLKMQRFNEGYQTCVQMDYLAKSNQIFIKNSERLVIFRTKEITVNEIEITIEVSSKINYYELSNQGRFGFFPK